MNEVDRATDASLGAKSQREMWTRKGVVMGTLNLPGDLVA